MKHEVIVPQDLHEKLKPATGEHLYAFLDAACNDELPAKIWALENNPQALSLFQNSSAEPLLEQAPYVVRLDRESPLTYWILDSWQKNPVGFFFKSTLSLEKLFNIYRTKICVVDDGNKTMLFRFYDPRVMLAYLQQAPQQDIQLLLDPMSALIVWDYYHEEFVLYKRDNDTVLSGVKEPTLSIKRDLISLLTLTLWPFKILGYLRANFIEQTHMLSDADILKNIRDDYIPRTIALGFEGESSVGLLSSLSLEFGANFEAHPTIKSCIGNGSYKTLSEALSEIDSAVWQSIREQHQHAEISTKGIW